MEQATPTYGSYTSTPLRSVHYGVDSINELAAIMEHILSKDAKMRQHTPIDDVEEALEIVRKGGEKAFLERYRVSQAVLR